MPAIFGAVPKTGNNWPAGLGETGSMLSHRLGGFCADLGDGSFLSIDGEVYNLQELDNLVEALRKKPGQAVIARGLRVFSENAIGQYAICFSLRGEKFFLMRDFLGIKPLWFGEGNGFFAFASEPQALRKNGVANPTALQPGVVLEVSPKGFMAEKVFGIGDFRQCIPDTHSLELLQQEFESAVSMQTRGLEKVAVLFSGGVDSSLVAKAVYEKVAGTKLFVAGVKGSHDLAKARKASIALGLDLVELELSEADVKSLAKEAAAILGLEKFDLMQVSLAVPELACAKEVSKNGIGAVFSGQGSDEIFCGYTDYATTLREKGFGAVGDAIWDSLERMPERNFYRDEIIFARASLALKTPFLCKGFLGEAMAFPPEEKILSASDALRKRPLRQLAKLFGLPDSITMQPKKAMQYGSGVQKIVLKLLKNGDLPSN